MSTRVEEAAINAWPSLQQMLYDGWLLRFADGYTKRANSVHALYKSHDDPWQKITFCERRYRERGLRPIFRLTPFSSPHDLDRVLDERGYTVIDPSLVLHLDLEQWRSPASPGRLYEEHLAPWMVLYSRFRNPGPGGRPPAKQHTHERMLDLIPGTRLLASVADGGRAVACGLGVLEDDLFGLFDVIVDPVRRCRGHGTRLVAAMLRWARERGARRAYLQVTEENTPARRLYDRLGFRVMYPYWYRVPERR